MRNHKKEVTIDVGKIVNHSFHRNEENVPRRGEKTRGEVRDFTFLKERMLKGGREDTKKNIGILGPVSGMKHSYEKGSRRWKRTLIDQPKEGRGRPLYRSDVKG